MTKFRKPAFAKLLTLCLIMAVFATGCGPSRNTISFSLDGKTIAPPSQAVIEKDSLMVPASFLEQAFSVTFTPPQAGQLEGAPGAGGNESDDQTPGPGQPSEGDHSSTDGTQSLEYIYYSGQVAVLMYHDLSRDPSNTSALPVETFRTHMELLQKRGFNVISMETYARFMLEHGKVPDNAVLITFDDGYESFLNYAYPSLREYGYAATNFIIVSSIDQSGPGIPKLTWEQMRQMQQEGMSFYSHTYNSHRYAPITADGQTKPALTSQLYLKEEQRPETEEEYVERITADLQQAEQRLREELGNTMSAIAFPYGVYNDDVLDVLRKLEISLSFTIKEGLNEVGGVIGFRINAGDLKLTPEELMDKLMALGGAPVPTHGSSTDAAEAGQQEQGLVTIVAGDREISLLAYRKSGGDAEWMVPLRDFCNAFGIGIDWNNSKKKVRLVRSASADRPVKM